MACQPEVKDGTARKQQGGADLHLGFGVQSSGQDLGVGEWLPGSLGNVTSSGGSGTSAASPWLGWRDPARSGLRAWPWAGLGVATGCHSASVETEECCAVWTPLTRGSEDQLWDAPKGLCAGTPTSRCIQGLHGKTLLADEKRQPFWGHGDSRYDVISERGRDLALWMFQAGQIEVAVLVWRWGRCPWT